MSVEPHPEVGFGRAGHLKSGHLRGKIERFSGLEMGANYWSSGDIPPCRGNNCENNAHIRGFHQAICSRSQKFIVG
jgi:hypothetical protein